MEVVVVRAADDEEIGVLRVLRLELGVVEVAERLELLPHSLQVLVVGDADHGDVQILVSGVAVRLLHWWHALLAHSERKLEASRKLHGSTEHLVEHHHWKRHHALVHRVKVRECWSKGLGIGQ